jgi:hypothetical protein
MAARSSAGISFSESLLLDAAHIQQSGHESQHILRSDVGVVQILLIFQVEARAARALVGCSDFVGVVAAAPSLAAAFEMNFDLVIVNLDVGDGDPLVALNAHALGLEPLGHLLQIDSALIDALVRQRDVIHIHTIFVGREIDQSFYVFAQQQRVQLLLRGLRGGGLRRPQQSHY